MKSKKKKKPKKDLEFIKTIQKCRQKHKEIQKKIKKTKLK